MLISALIPISGAAQTDATLRGRVTGASGSPDIGGARVELEGHGSTESSAAGMFTFERVAPGEYTLRVSAVGYVPAILRVMVQADTMVTVRLAEVAYRLDSLVVRARRINVEGRVEDRAKDLAIPNADVLTSQLPPTRTNSRGNFRLRDVWEGTPLALSISVFGYLPIDTVVTPAEGDRYVFNLSPDPVAERMIARQVERLHERARGRLSVVMRPLDREALLRSGGGSLREVIAARYGVHVRRIRCVLVDDRVLPRLVDGGILGTMQVEDVERVEVLFQGAMLRVYTREFIRKLVSRPVELRRPVYVAIPNPPVCE
jgi:hypothetical protein